MNVAFILAPVTAGLLGVTALAAADPSAADPSSVAPYISGLGAGAAVTGLLWVLKKLLDGTLVPVQVRDQQIELGQAIVAAGQREDRVMKLAEDTADTIRDLRNENRELRRELEQAIGDLARKLS